MRREGERWEEREKRSKQTKRELNNEKEEEVKGGLLGERCFRTSCQLSH